MNLFVILESTHERIFRVFVVGILLINNVVCFSQRNVSGKVFNSRTKEVLPYVSIGVVGKSSGTLSNIAGEYTLPFDEKVTDGDSITFSCIGFNTLKICVADHNSAEICMQPREYFIEDVVIIPTSKEVSLGFNQAVGDMSFRFFTVDELKTDERCAPEGGVILTVNRDCYVRRLNLKIATNNYENVKLRLTFYDLKNGLPDDIIVEKDIIFEITDKQTGWVHLDLTEYNIILQGRQDVAITLTLLEREMDGSRKWLSIYGAGIATQSTLYRHKAFDNWEKREDIALVMSLDVVPQTKNKKDTKRKKRKPRKTK